MSKMMKLGKMTSIVSTSSMVLSMIAPIATHAQDGSFLLNDEATSNIDLLGGSNDVVVPTVDLTNVNGDFISVPVLQPVQPVETPLTTTVSDELVDFNEVAVDEINKVYEALPDILTDPTVTVSRTSYSRQGMIGNSNAQADYALANGLGGMYEKMMVGGEPVFCLEPVVDYPSSGADLVVHRINSSSTYYGTKTASWGRTYNYTLDNAKFVHLERIAYYGFYGNSRSDKDYIYTQLMIWEYLWPEFPVQTLRGTGTGKPTLEGYRTFKATVNNKIAADKQANPYRTLDATNSYMLNFNKNSRQAIIKLTSTVPRATTPSKPSDPTTPPKPTTPTNPVDPGKSCTPKTHTVVRGDGGFAIARKYGISFAELQKLNPRITNWSGIMPGDTIIVGTESCTPGTGIRPPVTVPPVTPPKVIIPPAPPAPPTTTTSLETQPIPYNTIYRDNPNLDEGQTIERQRGFNGTKQRTSTYRNGVLISSTPWVTTKEKQDRIIERGTRRVETKTENKDDAIPYKTIRRINTNLKPGESKVVQYGRIGINRTTTTYERIIRGTAVGEWTVKSVVGPTTVVEKRDHIIEYNPTPIETPIPFKTVYEYDPNRWDDEPPVEKQVGVPGIAELVPTPNGSYIRRVKLEPKDRILVKGSRKSRGSYTYTSEVVVPYKRIVREDSTKSVLYSAVVQQGQNGSALVTYTQNTYRGNNQGEPIETSRTTITEVTDEIIVQGTQQ